MAATDIEARIADLRIAKPKACRFYDLPFKSGTKKIRLLHLHPTRYEHADPTDNSPPGDTVEIEGPEGTKDIPALSELFGALFIGGVHGDEPWSSEFQMDVAEKLADAIIKVQEGNPPDAFTGNPAGSGGTTYELSSDKVKKIVEKLDLYFIPVVNGHGRYHSPAKRTNAGDFDINRNFPFLYNRHHNLNDYYGATATPPDAVASGTGPASEVETQAIVAVLYKLPVNLFVDCHYGIGGSVTYPWACEGTQAGDETKSAFKYDLADATTKNQADGARGGGGYDEFLPQKTLTNLESAADASIAATAVSNHMYPTWSKGHGFNTPKPYIGVSDDFAMSLDICNMLAFTFEMSGGGTANERAFASLQYQSAIMAMLFWYVEKVTAIPPAIPLANPLALQRPIDRSIPKKAQGPQPPENWDTYRGLMLCVPNFKGSVSGPGGGGTSPGGGGSAGCGSILAGFVVLVAVTIYYLFGGGGPISTVTSGSSYTLDHYKVYDVRDVPLQGELGPGRPVFTEGQFDGGPKPGTLLTVTHFATPALITRPGESAPSFFNDRAHLTWYELQETEEDPVRRVTFTNQLGEDQKIVIQNAKYLLLPTTKLLNRPPDTVPDDLDHYKCYEVTESVDVDTGHTVDVEDQFRIEAGVVVGDPAYFCVPANKYHGMGETGPGLLNAEDHLVVYDIPSKRGPVPPFKTKDQFQDHPGFVVIETVFLCVPSKKTGFEVVAQ